MEIFKKNQEKVKMLLEKDIIEYLTSIGVYEKILEKKEHCVVCGEVITLTNLEALLPHDDEIRFVCSKVKCINEIKYDR